MSPVLALGAIGGRLFLSLIVIPKYSVGHVGLVFLGLFVKADFEVEVVLKAKFQLVGKKHNVKVLQAFISRP